MTQSSGRTGDSSVRYQPGDTVAVRVDNPGGHFRTPRYIQGLTGRVHKLCGVFPNPESLAYGGDGQPAQPLYRVEFLQNQVWTGYGGPGSDKIYVDIYEHWLEPFPADA
jgi:nitrile hydratase